MLDGYFPAFMAFFFPEAHADIDWTRGYESLDTELQQIVRDAPWVPAWRTSSCKSGGGTVWSR